MAGVEYKSKNDLDTALHYLARHFDSARLVDPILTEEVECGAEDPTTCYSVWGKDVRCRNCVSARVLITGEPAHKFERIDGSIFLVTSERVSTPTGPRVLELLSRMESRFEKHYAMQQDEFSHVEELSVMAYQDSMTGVFNRRYADERLAELIQDVKKEGDDLMVALIDVDNLKMVNDTYGHYAGDDLLKTVVAQALLAVEISGEENGFFARTGGDEFALVLRTKDVAQEVLQRVLDSIAEGKLEKYPQVVVSASIGAVMVSECDDKTLIGLCTVADKRLYAAKQAGRHNFVLGDKPSYAPPAPIEGENRLYRRDDPYTFKMDSSEPQN